MMWNNTGPSPNRGYSTKLLSNNALHKALRSHSLFSTHSYQMSKYRIEITRDQVSICKYWCRYRCYQHSVYCGILLSISNLLAYISLPPPLLLFLFTHFTDCINMASSQPEVKEESFRKGGKKTRSREDHSAT